MRPVAEVEPVNLTPMIDIVFQMVIFFIFTLDLEKEKFTQETKLAMAPHGAEVEEKIPETIYIEVTRKGEIMIAQTPLNEGQLLNILVKARIRDGQNIPVVVYADEQVLHSHIKRAMDVVGKAGFWKTSFSAIKEKKASGE